MKNCVFFSSFWGNDFRAAYLKVAELTGRFDCPVLPLSATMNQQIVDNISSILQIANFSVTALLPDRRDRPDISLDVSHSSNLDETMKIIALDLKSQKMLYPKTIIYIERERTCSSIDEVFEEELETDINLVSM
jgi:superfamily II DNA helicase RecQ